MAEQKKRTTRKEKLLTPEEIERRQKLAEGYEIRARRASLGDYFPATINPNKGTEEGLGAIIDSVNYVGPGRSGLADKNGQMIAGSHTLEAMEAAGIRKVIEIVADPDEWVIVKRPDMDLSGEGSEKTKALAAQLGDNRASEIGYSPDDPLIARILLDITQNQPEIAEAAGYSPKALAELTAMLEPIGTPQQGKNAAESKEGFLTNPIKQIVLFLKTEVFIEVIEKMAQIAHDEGLQGNSDVFLWLLEFYEEHHASIGTTETDP